MSGDMNAETVAAVRKLIHRLADVDPYDPDTDATIFDAVNDAVDRVESLESKVSELEEVVDPDPGAVEYDQLTKAQKVRRIRKTLLQNAAEGRAPVMKYRDVMYLFDSHPSAGHCYTLMERAADADGFHYEQGGHGDGEKRIRVEPDAVNDKTLIHAVNNATDKTPA